MKETFEERLERWKAFDARSFEETKYRTVPYDPAASASAWGWNSRIDNPANYTSHRVVVDAGVRVNAAGDPFHAWHSPNVVTEQVPVTSFVEFGMAQEYVTRKVKAVKPRTTTVRRSKQDAASEILLPPDTNDDTSKAQPIKLTPHERYERDKKRREWQMDMAYKAYVAGTGGGAVVDLAIGHIDIKAATQKDLYILRNDWNPKTIEDYVQEFKAEVLPRIERKEVTGKLSHYLNGAFRKHFISAKEKLKEEWSWKRFMAQRVGMTDTEGNRIIPGQSSDWIEEDDGTEFLEGKAEAVTGDDSRTPTPTTFFVPDEDDEANKPTEFDPEPAAATLRKIPLRVKMRATDLFKQGATPIERDVFTLMQQGHKGKVIAAQLGMTESTVSRLRNKIEARIVAIAQELTT